VAFHKALPLGRKNVASKSNIFGKTAFAKGRMESTPLVNEPVRRTRVDTLDRPGGTAPNHCPLITLYLPQDPTNKYQTSQCSLTTEHVDLSWITSITENAKRRCRSSGMNKPTFKENAQPNYFNDTRQYLDGKSKSFSQNQFTHTRRGPNSLISNNNNIYSSHGLSNCSKAYISSNSNHNYLQYLWVDAEELTIQNALELQFNEGYYTIEDFNAAMHMRLEEKGHYLIETATKRKVHFLHFIYNTEFKCIELQCLPMSRTLYPADRYSIPLPDLPFTVPTTIACVPVLVFPSNKLSTDLGFPRNHTEPGLAARIASIPFAVLSSSSYKFGPLYNTVNYKPSNLVFRQEGGVSSSAEILRKKNNAILYNAERKTVYDKRKMAKPWNLCVPVVMSRCRKSLFNG
jgi:hypothetical protein